MSLHGIQSRRQRRDDRDDQAQDRLLISAEQFRKLLGLGNRTFTAMKLAGRFDHLRAAHFGSATRTYYVRAAALAWASEQLQLHLRPVSHKAR